jgi:hypothetical protein
MRNDMQGVDVGAPLQVGSHLTQTIRSAIQNMDFADASQAIGQPLVVGNAGIDENKVPGHDVVVGWNAGTGDAKGVS